MEKNIQIEKKEVLRYLGYKNQKPDEATEKLIQECMEEVYEYVTPRCVYQRFSVNRFWGEKSLKADEQDDDGDGNLRETVAEKNPEKRAVILEIASMKLTSTSLAKNLEGCEEVILFVATLGSEFDRLMNRYSKLEITKAACMQAVGAAAIEAYCDACQYEIEREIQEEAFGGQDTLELEKNSTIKLEHKKARLHPRFSPGYGDLPLEIQKEFLDALDATKRIGIHLTEGNIMMPEKSVTAFIGIEK